MHITKNFTYQELCRTDTKVLNLCGRIEYIANLARVCQWLEFVRLVVECPIIVTSGFRSPKVNELVGGAKHSYHLRGLAVDFKTKDPSKMEQAYDLLKANMEFQSKEPNAFNCSGGRIVELINEPTWIHLAVEDYNN